MKLLLAWLSLAHHKTRTLAAVAGIAFCISLVFLQLGLYASVMRSALQIHEKLDYDVLLVSPEYLNLARTGWFPRQRLRQAAALPGVASAVPFYTGARQWRNPETRRHLRLLVMGFNTRDHVFNLPEIDAARNELERPDVVFIDRRTRPEFGSQARGTVTEIGPRQMTVAGQYTIGTGFDFYGAAIVSDVNFSRLFEGISLDKVNLGLIRLNRDADPEACADALSRALPADVRVLTRAQLTAQEQQYWAQETPAGMVFGLGIVLAVVVGMVILYQVLATDIARHLPEYATLKALGYRDRFLRHVVLLKVLFLVLLAYLPALGLALGLYALIREAANLPVDMNVERAGAVLVLSILMGSGTGLSCLRRLRAADPADLFGR
ncbi:MAG TPA: ABC transporter permease DevC [Gemmataceae bacterium]|jgi:putative ABC transport system permease protein|nr:ABC transporter permease DevC [Gemmataceae bacterium]